MGFSLVAESGGYSLVVVLGFLTAVTSAVAENGSRTHGLQKLPHTGSAVVAPRLSSTGSIVDQQALTLQPGEAHTLLS